MTHGNVPPYPLNNFHTNGPHCNQTKSAAPLFMHTVPKICTRPRFTKRGYRISRR